MFFIFIEANTCFDITVSYYNLNYVKCEINCMLLSGGNYNVTTSHALGIYKLRIN